MKRSPREIAEIYRRLSQECSSPELLTPAEQRAFNCDKARVQAMDEHRRNPQPQLELAA